LVVSAYVGPVEIAIPKIGHVRGVAKFSPEVVARTYETNPKSLEDSIIRVWSTQEDPCRDHGVIVNEIGLIPPSRFEGICDLTNIAVAGLNDDRVDGRIGGSDRSWSSEE
jgi:hypothetical protein